MNQSSQIKTGIDIMEMLKLKNNKQYKEKTIGTNVHPLNRMHVQHVQP